MVTLNSQQRKGVRVNVGCGSTPTPGYRNFDNSMSVRLRNRPTILRVLVRTRLAAHDSSKLAAFARSERIEWATAGRLPLPDRSVDVLYSSHMIEHLDRSEVQRFLREAQRVLTVGGTIRLAVPDLAALVREYIDTGDADALIDQAHMCVPKPASLLARVRSAVIGPRHHHWMYDEDSLCRLLTIAGFVNAGRCAAGETRIPDPGPLDLAERSSESLYVEAVVRT
jgi:SAM-dependent methyltransferase